MHGPIYSAWILGPSIRPPLPRALHQPPPSKGPLGTVDRGDLPKLEALPKSIKKIVKIFTFSDHNVLMTFFFIFHCTENPIYVFPEMKRRGLVPNSYQNRQTDPGNTVYKSLTDT